MLRPLGALPSLQIERFPQYLVRDGTNHRLVAQLLEDLDVGEAHAIELAKELNADAVLIDEAAARTSAIKLGLHTTGVLGVLLLAKHDRLVGPIRPLIHSLREELGFFLTDSLVERVLRHAGE